MSVTVLLDRWASGEPDAASELLSAVYPELQRLAGIALCQEWSRISWQRTTLVNEAALRLLRLRQPNWESRAEFFADAISTLRRILIESARKRRSLKRWGRAERVPLTEDVVGVSDTLDDAIAVSVALDQLRVQDPRGAQIVELRFFLGLKNQEVADLLGLSLRTVEREYEFSRACLRRNLASVP